MSNVLKQAQLPGTLGSSPFGLDRLLFRLDFRWALDGGCRSLGREYHLRVPLVTRHFVWYVHDILNVIDGKKK